ncbi:MAG: hypothetical protein ACRDA3_07840 [Peptostreptococcaceae bacterium]
MDIVLHEFDENKKAIICVDMECSAVGAVASFREKEVYQMMKN